MKRRILVFTTSYWPRMGGAEVAVQEIALRLSDTHEFYIITSRGDRSLPKVEQRPEGTVIRVGFCNAFDKWLLPIWGALVGRRYICECVALWGIDISQGSLAASVLKCMRAHVPLVLNVQYGYGENRLRKGRFGFMNLAFRFMLAKADYVTVLSSYLQDIVMRFGYSGKIKIVPNGVDLAKFKIQPNDRRAKLKNDSKIIIITTSRLVKKNAVNDAIDALKFLPVGVFLDILGTGKEEVHLKRQVKRLRLDKRVRFLGYQTHEKMIEFMRNADIFVRPSLSEGLGNSFLEAMALGMPVIGTNIGGIKDFLRNSETGWVVPTHDPKAIAETVEHIMDGHYNDTITNAERVVRERYNWDTISAKFAEIFASV